MTDEIKAKIDRLCSQGFGYQAISEVLNLPLSTVRSHLQRDSKAGNYASCKQCGRKIKVIPGRKKKIFCSGTCRQKWWNSHPECVNRKAIYSFVCEVCGKEFTAYGNNHRKYCSRECYLTTVMKKDKSGAAHE